MSTNRTKAASVWVRLFLQPFGIILKNFIYLGKEGSIMSEELLNKHRPTSMEEPSDEMLAQIIHEVAVEAEESTEKARKKFFDELRRSIKESQ